MIFLDSTPKINQQTSEHHLEIIPINSNDLIAFEPETSPQDIFLKNFREQGIIGEDYRLKINTDNLTIPELETEQITQIEKLISGAVSVSILNEKSCSFSPLKLFKTLYNINTNDITRIDLIGGFVRELLILSPTYCKKMLQALGVELINTPPIETLIDSYEHKLFDVDIRIMIPSAKIERLKNFTEKTCFFLNQELQNTEYKKTPKKKYCFVEKENVALSMISFGKWKSKHSTISSRIELIFASKIRENLFLHNDFKIDLRKRILSENNEKSDFKFEGAKAKNIWQTCIDILGKVLHVDDPQTIDRGGLPMVISHLLRGFVLGDAGVLEHLTKTFLIQETLHIKLPSQMLSDITRCLKNHHKKDSVAVILFFYNFIGLLRESISEETIRYLCDQLFSKIDCEKEEMSKLSKCIYQALQSKQVSFNAIEAILGLSAFLCMNKIEAKSPSKNQKITLRKHTGKPFIQIKVGKSFCSYILIPFEPTLFLKRLKSELSEENEIILSNLSQEIFSLACEEKKSDSIIDVHHKYFPDEYENLLREAEHSMENAHELVRALSFQLVTCLNSRYQKNMNETEQFPVILLKESCPIKRKRFFNEFTNVISHSPFGKLVQQSHIKFYNYLGETFNAKAFLKLWIKLLAQTQDFELCESAKKLYKKFINKYSEQSRLKLTLELIENLLPVGIVQAQNIFLDFQKKRPNNFQISQEEGIVSKMLSSIKPFKQNTIGSSEFLLMIDIILYFLRYYHQKNSSDIHKITFSKKKYESFLKRIFHEGFIDQGEIILELMTKLKIIPLQESTELFCSLCSAAFDTTHHRPLSAYETWKKGESLQIWKDLKDSDIYNYVLVRISEDLLRYRSNDNESYIFLKMVATKISPHTQFRKKITIFIHKHLNILINSDPNNVLKELKGVYRKHLTAEETFNCTLNLINRYIALKNSGEALKLWEKVMSSPLRKNKQEAVCHATEGLILLFLKIHSENIRKTKITHMLTHKNFPDTFPFLRDLWSQNFLYTLEVLKDNFLLNNQIQAYLVENLFQTITKQETLLQLEFYLIIFSYKINHNCLFSKEIDFLIEKVLKENLCEKSMISCLQLLTYCPSISSKFLCYAFEKFSYSSNELVINSTWELFHQALQGNILDQNASDRCLCWSYIFNSQARAKHSRAEQFLIDYENSTSDIHKALSGEHAEEKTKALMFISLISYLLNFQKTMPQTMLDAILKLYTDFVWFKLDTQIPQQTYHIQIVLVPLLLKQKKIEYFKEALCILITQLENLQNTTLTNNIKTNVYKLIEQGVFYEENSSLFPLKKILITLHLITEPFLIKQFDLRNIIKLLSQYKDLSIVVETNRLLQIFLNTPEGKIKNNELTTWIELNLKQVFTINYQPLVGKCFPLLRLAGSTHLPQDSFEKYLIGIFKFNATTIIEKTHSYCKVAAYLCEESKKLLQNNLVFDAFMQLIIQNIKKGIIENEKFSFIEEAATSFLKIFTYFEIIFPLKRFEKQKTKKIICQTSTQMTTKEFEEDSLNKYRYYSSLFIFEIFNTLKQNKIQSNQLNLFFIKHFCELTENLFQAEKNAIRNKKTSLPWQDQEKQIEIFLSAAKQFISVLLKTPNDFSFIQSIQILTAIQNVSSNNPTIKQCYEIILKKLFKNMHLLHQQVNIFNSITRSFFQIELDEHNCDLQTHIKFKNDLCNQILTFALNEIDKDIYLNDKLQIKAHLIIFGIYLLEYAMQHGFFVGNDLHKNYFNLIEPFIKKSFFPLTTFFDNVSIEKYLNSVFYALCGREDHETFLANKSSSWVSCPFSNEIKTQREQMMIEWIQNLIKESKGITYKNHDLFFKELIAMYIKVAIRKGIFSEKFDQFNF